MDTRHLRSLATQTALPLLICASLGAQIPQTTPAEVGAGGIGTLATTVGSAQFVIDSQNTGREYLVQVAYPIPDGPESIPPTGERYPVLYVLDGQTSFGMFSAMARLLQLEGSIRPALIVAVSHRFETVAHGMELRAHDYVHRAVPVQLAGPPVSGGGGGSFEEFLFDELRPFIETNFPAEANQAILAGHSLGGLFASTVLARDPQSFRGYMIASPSLQYDPQLLGRIAQAASRGEGRRVFVAAGSEEHPVMVSAAAQLERSLRVGASAIEVDGHVAEGDAHFSVLAPWVSRGLRYLLTPSAP